MKTLKFGNGTWATKKGSILAHNDEGGNFKPLPFTYTGAGKGTRVNKEGLIEVVENDRPRIDYLDSEDGVFLLEKAATNLVTYSSDLSVLSKVSVGTASSPVTTANYDIAPDGTMTATRVVFDLNGGTTSQDRSILRQSIPLDSNYKFSIYVKSTNGAEQKVMWHDGGEYNPTTVTNEWVRITYDGRPNTVFGGIALNPISGVDTSDILVWGFQIESGNVSSYIPTQGTIQTRVQETASGSGNSEVFNDSQGVLFADISALSEIDTYRTICLSDGSTSERINIWYWNDGTIKIDLYNSNNKQFEYDGIVDTTLFNKIAIKYKVNDFSIFLNGFEVFTDLVGTTPIGLNKINFSHANELYPFYGKTKEIAYYDTALTDLELETLTSYRTWESMVKELNLNIIHNE